MAEVRNEDIIPAVTATVPERGFFGYARDLALDATAGAIDVLATPATITRDITPDIAEQRRMRAVQRIGGDVKDWIRSGKTEYGQHIDKTGGGDRGWLQEAFEVIPQSAAPLGTALATGAAAPLTFGVLARGQQGMETEESLRKRSVAELMQSPNYAKYREQGMSDEDALLELYKDHTTFEAVAPNVAANVIFGGVAGRLYGRAFSKSVSQKMTERIIKNAMQDIPETVIGGALTGAGVEYGRQAGEISAGLRKEHDSGAVITEAMNMARPLGVMGGATALGRSLRGPPRAPPSPGRTTQDLLDAANQQTAPPLGVELPPVAAENLTDKTTEATPPTPPTMAGAGVTPPGNAAAAAGPTVPPVAAGVPTPPVPSAAAGPVVPPVPSAPAAEASLTARSADAATRRVYDLKDQIDQLDQEHPDVQATPEWQAQRQQLNDMLEAASVERDALARVDTPAVGPGVAAAAPVAAPVIAPVATPVAAPKKTVGQKLKEKVAAKNTPATKPVSTADLGLAPSEIMGDLPHPIPRVEKLRQTWLKHTENASGEVQMTPAWQKANDALFTRYREAAHRAEAVERAKADETKAATREVTQPGKPVEVKVEKAEEAVPDEKPNTETLRAKLGLKPKAEGVVHGEKAAEIIAAEQPVREARAKEALETVATGIVAGAKRGAETQGTSARREDKVNTRDTTAKTVLEEHMPGDNYAKELDAIEVGLKSNVPDDAGVIQKIQDLVKDIKEVVDAYKGKLHELSGGKKDVVYALASSGGYSRAGKGDYHSYMSDLNNYVIKVTKALEKNKHTEAKELTLRYLEDSRRVREGELTAVRAEQQAKSDAITTEKRTHSGDEKIDVERVNETQQALEAKIEEVLKDNPLKPITRQQARNQGMRVPRRNKATGEIIRDKNNRIIFDDPVYPMDTTKSDADFVPGVPDNTNPKRVADLKAAANKAGRKQGRKLNAEEFSKVARAMGEEVEQGTLADALKPFRPDNWILRPIFDAIYDVVKDMPAQVWTRDMMEAYARHLDPTKEAGLAFYNPLSGYTVFRPATMTPATVFHEAIHAATSRALHGSERLTSLVEALQGIVESRFKGQLDITGEVAYQVAIKGSDGKKINAREFIAELFSRPEVADLLMQVNLTRAEADIFRRAGYRADIGQNILKVLWQDFLEFIGFNSPRPNGYKVAVDLLQDMFEREMFIRKTDAAQGRGSGQILSDLEAANYYYQDKIGGPAVVKAFQAGDHPEVARQLMSMAERGALNEQEANNALKYLGHLNMHYWGPDTIGDDARTATPLSNAQQVQSGVVDYIEKRFGPGAANAAWQVERRFGTPLRAFTLGMRYTNDLGNNLEQAFQTVIKPLKDAWSNRENYSQKYMETSGANQLIDDIATAKHGIKDRQLWTDFENLLIRESYARTRADEELGVGGNLHINTGDLRDRQSVRDHAVNRKLLEEIRKRDPGDRLLNLRNRIYDFTKKEMEERNKASIRELLLRLKVAPHGDEVVLNALTKHIRREDKLITHAERMAMERLLGTDHESKTWRTWEKNRDDIRGIAEAQSHSGPHVPFSRHGNHAVYAEYDVRPDAGVKYNEVDPTADTHKQYDFVVRKDAEDFIDNVLSHPDININLRNAHEIVYDTRSGVGERASIWTITKSDGTAKTYDTRADAEAAEVRGDKITKRDLTLADLKQMQENNIPTGHFEVRHRVVFNPREFVKFESERDAHNYREQLNSRFDSAHVMEAGPRTRTTPTNIRIKVANVETPHDAIGRANVAYTSAEMRQWINRQEASPEYQRMDPTEKAEWARKLRVEAARVTATAGRRTMNMPRDYVKGASTDILKNMIDYSGANARNMADLTFRNAIDKGLTDAEAYVNIYKNQSGGLAGNHRARDETVREIKKRLFAPPRVEDSWAIAVKRALQVSMIGHLADTGYLVVNAIEPWVFGAALSAARHGWVPTYREMAEATKLIDPWALARAAGDDIAAAFKGEYGANVYEGLLLQKVTGAGNKRGDGAALSRMLIHMFNKGLAARDVGMEVERIHDPSQNIAFRGFDRVDNVFRGFNTGVETFNRGMMAIANFRLEMKRAEKDGVTGKAAEMQALRFAEDSIFKAAGDYGQWNNPRYFNNPMLKLALQFKKYPLRIFSVYADAAISAFKGDKEAQKRVAYLLISQAVAAGALGLPLASFGAGLTNAAYLLGITDDNWPDVEFAMRKWLTDQVGVEGADLALRGAFRFTGADFNAKMSQNSFLFHGSPDSRNPMGLLGTMGKVALGAPGDTGVKLFEGIQKLGQAAGHYSAGADTEAMATGMEGVQGVLQIKMITDVLKAGGMMFGNVKGLPKGQEATTAEAAWTALGFQPTSIATRLEEKRVTKREIKKESEARNLWVNRWRDAPNSSEQAAIWSSIQRDYNAGQTDSRLKIQYGDLWKAQQRKKADERRDDSKIGVRLTGRQKAFSDIHGYFDPT